MKFRIVKLNDLSGKSASVYSIYMDDEKITLFEKFLEENVNLLSSELYEMIARLKVMGKKTGAREQFFKLNEGNPGDGVCALYDEPGKNLRLYCIRYGTLIVVLGSGGEKPKELKALQESDKLTEENYLLREIAGQINQRIKEKEIGFTDDGLEFTGDLDFTEDTA